MGVRMKKRFSEQQILKILKEGESGISLENLCRKHNMGQSTYYSWRSKYGGMELSDVKRLKALEEENRRLKALYADTALEKQILQDIVDGKL